MLHHVEDLLSLVTNNGLLSKVLHKNMDIFSNIEFLPPAIFDTFLSSDSRTGHYLSHTWSFLKSKTGLIILISKRFPLVSVSHTIKFAFGVVLNSCLCKVIRSGLLLMV